MTSLFVIGEKRMRSAQLPGGRPVALAPSPAACFPRPYHLVYDEISVPVSTAPRGVLQGANMIGSRIGPYRITRQLGQGGMGTVYEAVHEAIGRRVAIKVLLPQFATAPEVAVRFLNEARAVNLVTHPGLVQISDYGQLPDGTAYIVMELLDGETLTKRIHASGGRLSVPEILRMTRQIASALTAAHAKGIVHREQSSPILATGEGCGGTIGDRFGTVVL